LEIKPQALLDFLRPLPVDRIWGLGKKSKEILDNLGIKTIGDLAKKSKEDLILLFGKSGEHFWYLAQGLDERMVSYEDQEKSISNEVTFEQDSSDRFKIEKTLLCLSEKVCRRLRIGGYKAKTVTVKIRLKGFLTYTRAMTLNQATNFDDVIYRTAKKLYSDFSAQGKKIRLVGIRLSNFMPVNIQDTIFQGVKESKRQNFYKAIDAIKDKFGPNTIKRAAVLESRNEENLY
jgi:DNA polymerase-4